MYALWSEKKPEVNDAGDSRVGVRMGDFLFKIQPNRNYSAIYINKSQYICSLLWFIY